MSNTVHDMGGMHGFGPVVPEANEPPFHERWEGRVFALQRAMGFTGSIFFFASAEFASARSFVVSALKLAATSASSCASESMRFS